ncbi:BTAD domain-containing putative transcriptional regulator [Nonomuraea sp. B12E4]|uniref:AfsR/SARP family transcriptional regulator n=1 Tax=Nonomuraea sp. B12E4 TaxID=3153564 RepID=UPI00325DC305
MAGDEQLTVSSGSERLLALIAIGRRTVPRAMVASTLWPGAPERRAQASLRSALARLDEVGRRMLLVDSSEIGLDPRTSVDFEEGRSLARRLLDPDPSAGSDDVHAQAIETLSDGLLPGWYEEWMLAASDEWDQLRLHALEALSAHFIKAGRFADAVAAASVATHTEPLRESACAALIAAYLAEGNQVEALRHFREYESNLRAELGIGPTSRLCDLVVDLHVGRDQ